MLHIFLVNQVNLTRSFEEGTTKLVAYRFFLELAKDLWDKRDYHNLDDIKN